MEKYCGKCEHTKPAEEFSKNARSRDGLGSQCKLCAKKARRETAERDKAVKKIYLQTHAEKVRESQRAHRLANKEELAAKARQRYQDNKEALLAYKHAYSRANSEKIADSGARRRAMKRDVTVETVERLTVFQRDAWTCQICLASVEAELKWPDSMSASLDHVIPLSKGGEHSYKNTQLAHLVCNLKKANRLGHETL